MSERENCKHFSLVEKDEKGSEVSQKTVKIYAKEQFEIKFLRQKIRHVQYGE